jgi:hypothetical protein
MITLAIAVGLILTKHYILAICAIVVHVVFDIVFKKI